MRVRTYLAALLALLLASPALAGWVIHSSQSGPGGEASTETVLIQNNKMKVAEDRQIVIFDIDKGVLYVLIPERKVYFTGTPEELSKAAEDMANKMKEAIMAQLPPAQREAYEQMMEKGEGEVAAAQAPSYEVKKTSETATVAGYPTVKHQVMKEGVLHQELWTAPKIKAQDELDLAKMRGMLEGMQDAGGAEQGFEASPEFLTLVESGFPLKTVDYDGSDASDVKEATQVEKKDIPASEFLPPEDYTKVTVEQMFGQMMGGGP